MFITSTRQVVLKAMCATPALRSTEAARVIAVTFQAYVAKGHVRMAVKGTMDVYPRRLFYITIANFGMNDGHLPSHQNVDEVATAPKK